MSPTKLAEEGGVAPADHGKCGKSGDEMDEERRQQIAYEYLCHLEEARTWMSGYVGEELPPTTELENSLRNGVTLAKLAARFAVPRKSSSSSSSSAKIFDADQSRFAASGLHFRHTDNINYFLKAIRHIGLPEIFAPETTDIYDAKNMPRVIFCIHALSLYLYRLGLAPPMQDLFGKVTFTAEEISAIRSALDRYAVPLPAFRRIGGMLADEMPVDEAERHAAIIAINETLAHNDPPLTLAALTNPSAQLNSIDPDSAKKYQIVLASEKQRKVADFRGRQKKMSSSSITYHDAYDEMLSGPEIQGHLDKVNLLNALELVEAKVNREDADGLIFALQSRSFSHLRLAVKKSNATMYLRQLSEAMKTIEFLRTEDLESCVAAVNQTDFERFSREAAISAASDRKARVVADINAALECNDLESLIKALKDPSLGIENYILSSALPLYLSELHYIREASGVDLKAEGIVKVCQFLHNVACINSAVKAGDWEEVYRLASEPSTNLEDVHFELRMQYTEVMKSMMSQKQQGQAAVGPSPSRDCKLLNHAEIQDAIDFVNSRQDSYSNSDKIEAVHQVNVAIRSLDHALLFKALTNPSLGLQAVFVQQNQDGEEFMCEKDSLHFLRVLRNAQRNSRASADDGVEAEEGELWLEHIVEAVKDARAKVKEAKAAAFSLAILNLAVLQNDEAQVFEMLKRSELNVPTMLIRSEDKQRYAKEMLKLLRLREDCGAYGVWVEHKLSDGNHVYLNLKEPNHSWRKPRDFCSPNLSCYLGTDDVVSALRSVNDRDGKISQELVTKLQAKCRGYLVRKRLFTMLQHYYEKEDRVIKVQAFWRGRQQRRKYQQLLKERAEKLSSRGLKHHRSLAHYKRLEPQIVRIQRAWRQHRSRVDFQTLLTNQDRISVLQVRKYLHLLDLQSEDFDKELELQNLRGEITKKIRLNQGLEKDLDQMDIKIGLLVRNQIDVQDVLAHNKSLVGRLRHQTKSAAESSSGKDDASAGAIGTLASGSSGAGRGLKALKKESREKLDAYQNLFYLLQTEPKYLAKLIFLLPMSNSTKFMESVILSLYNYGSNHREEFLLLKLFRVALEEEVFEKVAQPGDIVTGSPLVIQMIVRFYRAEGGGKSSLRELLGSLVNRVLDDKDLNININPVEIYKQWVNSLEFDSGRVAGMPYDVSAEGALQHEEVKKRLNRSLVKLRQVTTMFLATITKSRSKLPYGILFMAKVLANALRKKFPGILEKEVLKIVGNLIYYRFINSAIVAPDGFDILGSGSAALSNDQRRNLASIAKILQAAAMKKGFGDEAAHLGELNPYIVELHEKFKAFFAECCSVVDPEDHFDVNQYSEATLIAKPVIYVSLQEICDTHRLLLKYREKLISEAGEKDRLNELLDDLNGDPSLCSLIGAAPQLQENDDRNLSQLAKTEVCLTLTDKFPVPAVDRLGTDRMFVKTKQLLASVLMCTDLRSYSDSANLIGILKSKTSREQEELYWKIMAKKDQVDEQAEKNRTMLDHTNVFEDDEVRLSLEDSKRHILKSLQVLERHGYVSNKDGCRAIVVSLAKDICNQREYRFRRRMEILRLKKVIFDLDRKTKFHEEQVEYYNQYLKRCLANLNQSFRKKSMKSGKKRVAFSISEGTGQTQGDKGELRSRAALKYSAARLHEKGVLVSIDGLPQNQFKNVLFEIVPDPDQGNGMFQIHAKFMGVPLEHVDVDIQELLQLQYEGVAVKSIFGKAKVNVNLLLHLLNAKFYGKKK